MDSNNLEESLFITASLFIFLSIFLVNSLAF